MDPIYKERENYLMNNTYDNSNQINDNKLRNRIKKILENRIKNGNNNDYKDKKILENRIKNGNNNYYKDKKIKYKDKKIEKNNRKKGGKVSSSKNQWIKFLKEYRKNNPNIKGKKVMINASKLYKKK